MNAPEEIQVVDEASKTGAQLYSSAFNSVPVGASVDFLTTSDSARLRFARWEPHTRPSKGTIIILHGRSEFIEKYFETVEDLRKRGFGVLTFDWRGQGGSSRMLKDRTKGHVENFDNYLTDLEAIISEVALPDCKAPLYILAHSTGSLVALLAAPRLANRVRRMVLVSPLLALNNLPLSQDSLMKTLGFLTFLGLGAQQLPRKRSTIEPRPFAENKLTTDRDRYQRTRTALASAPDLAIGPPTIGWIFAACRAMSVVNQTGFSNAISVPTLLLAAGNDAVVSPSAIEGFGRAMRTGSCLTVSGAKHELMDERDIYREQFLAAFEAFVPGEG